MRYNKPLRRPYRIRKKKSILKNKFFWIIFVFLVIGGSIFYSLLFIDFFQIKKITISGEEKVSNTEIKSVIENDITKKVLFFKTNSIFLANLNKISRDLLGKFPQIGKVEIKKIYPDSVTLQVKERKEVGLFCRENSCFLLDNEGVIFENSRENLPLLKIQGQQLQTEPKLGEKMIEKELLSKILEINNKLKNNFNIPFQEVIIVSEQRLNIRTADGWEIYFNLKGDLSWQIIKLNSILENKIFPGKRKNLKYIDLRFEKVYIFPENYNQ